MSFIIEWQIANMGGNSLRFVVALDKYSLAFLFTVGLISRCIFLFSSSYIGNEKYFLRFHLLVLRFVFSIVLLIISPNLVRLLLGWDGLGVTSYLLVVYFQRSKAYNAGMITALTNRIGDVFILLSIGIIGFLGGWNFVYLAHSSLPMGAVVTLIGLASLTKSAQIPFSAWLPAAIAAPTPVSALVHSSTLVTAGVYLLFRFQPIIRFSYIRKAVLLLGALTILIAGLAAIVEIDIKKIVALSTLSQLGVIILSIGAGLTNVAYFHLLSHAYFKALLFITVGAIIHISSDYQDVRKISLIRNICPTTLRFNLAANLSLCGLPFTRGFFSKDSCIELFVRGSTVLPLSLVFYTATALTAAYSLRFVIIAFFSIPRSSVIIWRNDKDRFMLISIGGLFPLALIGGRFLLWTIFWNIPESFLRGLEKNSTLTVILLGLLFRLIFLNWIPKTSESSPLNLLGTIWSIPLISSRIFNCLSFWLRNSNRKLSDQSWIPYILVWHLKRASYTKSPWSLRRFEWSPIIGLGLVFGLFGIVLLYLHVINLFIFTGFKNQIYT